MKDWLDENRLCKPQAHWGNSGNGITYTVVAMCLYPDYYNANVVSCWDDDVGVLKRTPDNKYGQQSHDDYTSIGIYCLMYNPKLARRIILAAIKRLGFMQNDFVEENAFWRSQMFRFPQIWIVMIAAAFPLLLVKWLCAWLCSVVIRLSTVNVQNASGIQLTFLLAHAARLMGSPTPSIRLINEINAQGTTLADIMKNYYGLGHPSVEGFRLYELNIKEKSV